MPAIGMDPRTGQLIVLPGGGGVGTGQGWGPDRVRLRDIEAQERRQAQALSIDRMLEEWQRQDIKWIEELVEGYLHAVQTAEKEAKRNLIRALVLCNPYMAQAVFESGVSPEAVIESPAIFSEVAQLAFLKYQEDVKRAWQEGKGPLRPLTAEEFVAQLLMPQGHGVEHYIGLTGAWDFYPFTPLNVADSYPDLMLGKENLTDPGVVFVPWQGRGFGQGYSIWAGPGVYALIPHYRTAGLPDWLLTAKRFFPWATDEAWWLQDPDYLAFNPAAKPGYGKVSEAPPGFEAIGDGVYRDPETGFLYFARTGAYLGHGFLDYYKSNAGFLGEPITNEFSVGDKTYQVFQGGVLSWDPETGRVSYHKNLAEAGLAEDQIEPYLTVPSYWNQYGQPLGSGVSLGKGTWTVDPYIGSGSEWYDEHPAQSLLPEEEPSDYPFAGYSDIYVNPKAVWVKGSNGMFQEPDPWMRSMFMGQIRTNPDLKNWYYSLGDLEKNQVFANYLATGQIYL